MSSWRVERTRLDVTRLNVGAHFVRRLPNAAQTASWTSCPANFFPHSWQIIS